MAVSQHAGDTCTTTIGFGFHNKSLNWGLE
jgi:hypothetical protein